MTLYEMMKVGERANTLARLFNCREGFTPADDVLPARMHEGIGNGALRGERVGLEQFLTARRLHYEMDRSKRATPTTRRTGFGLRGTVGAVPPAPGGRGWWGRCGVSPRHATLHPPWGRAPEPRRRRPEQPNAALDGLGSEGYSRAARCDPSAKTARQPRPETGGHAMSDVTTGEITRRDLLKAGALLAGAPIMGAAAPAGAQTPGRSATKVHDFLTFADVARAEQEGEIVYYGHDGEAGLAALLEAFRKDFPKIKTSYVRAQTGALYAKITAERSAGRFGVDVLQLSDISPAVDFQKKGGYEPYQSPSHAGYKPIYQSTPAGYWAWMGVSFAGIGYNTTKVSPEQAPKAWKDILNPAFKDGISAKLSSSGMQHAQWYTLRKLFGEDFWREFAKQRPRGFDSRAQLFDRLAKGDDRVCALAEYAGYVLHKEKGAEIEFVMPADGLPATPVVTGVVNRAPHPEAAKLFVDWALSNRGQSVYQTHKILLYGSVRTDAPPMATGKRLADFKLLLPTDWDDYRNSHPIFVKEWNAIMGL